MLAAPRELVACALDLLDAPPKALLFCVVFFGTSRLPTRSPPLAPPRFPPPPKLPEPAFDPPRFAPPAPVFAGRVLAVPPPRFGVVLPGRLFDPALLLNPCCCRAFACRLAAESPRVVPPYLVAVALLE